MTLMLASINSVAEAEIVLAEQVDIIDLKNPANGALGRLDSDVIREILAFIDGKCPTSATVGDLPMEPQLIADAVREVASTGVDYIKIGLTSDASHIPVIGELAQMTEHYRLIAVFFTDQNIRFVDLERLKKAGFSGVMLDTFDKSKGSITEILRLPEIENFVNKAKSNGMRCGLAGSLRLADIPVLSALKPDYLGFRSALCQAGERNGKIQKEAVRSVKQALAKIDGKWAGKSF